MKKLALAICLLVVSIAAQAQFEKGKMILNPSVTGLDFRNSKNDKAKFGNWCASRYIPCRRYRIDG